MQYLEEAALLRQQGHRLTPQRLQVLQVIKAHGQHMTAEEIHAAIVPQQPYLDIATVYRTLLWLQRVGLVAPRSIAVYKLRYEDHAPGNHHPPLVCLYCGHQIQIPDADLAALKQDLPQRYGFDLQIDHL